MQVGRSCRGGLRLGSRGGRSTFATSSLTRRAWNDAGDAVRMRCSQDEACHVGFDLRARGGVVDIAECNAKGAA